MLPDPFVLPGGIVVEDVDPQVQYTGGWTILGSGNGYHGGQLHMSQDLTASITFSFTGSHIWYYSDLNADHGRFSIAVDSDTPQEYSSHSESLQVVQALFEQELDPGQHTITIQNRENKTLGLDFFLYSPLHASASTSSTSTASSSASAPSSFSSVSADADSAAQSSAHTTVQRHPVTLPAGAIVGIVLSSLAVLLFCVLIIVMLRDRRRRAALLAAQMETPVRTPTSITPMQQYASDNRPPGYNEPSSLYVAAPSSRSGVTTSWSR
ncbi:hypothetical protein EXIGLDRAFT_830733 [Exidia glandulosa HHB12029]|uniref:Uncharacterized protein n=1 Tax=Exidia glandulosa HHB12029 TaxID=1314781 RepID=A0A165NDK0_EXIGL|nr:hypothetical protein EXIGLDRAFT_830733 [Exidia glandulosa HHB12029]